MSSQFNDWLRGGWLEDYQFARSAGRLTGRKRINTPGLNADARRRREESVFLRPLLVNHASQPGIEHIAECIANKIEREHQQKNGKTRYDGQQGLLIEHRERLL